MPDQRYVKKPIRARQWFTDGDCPAWAQGSVVEFGEYFEIRTREGSLKGVPGDWIMEGVEGEIYPCGAEIFAKTYEPATR